VAFSRRLDELGQAHPKRHRRSGKEHQDKQQEIAQARKRAMASLIGERLGEERE
jgi:hypothetical protein